VPKLSQIIEPFGQTLGVHPRSINVLAMTLRKAGLISKGGRGPAGAEMRSCDCTNLLLAAMAGGEATSAHETVMYLRSAIPLSMEGSTVPPVNFIKSDLGETLDTLFDEMMQYGGVLTSDYDLPITNMSLIVPQPNKISAGAEIWIDDGDRDGSIRFHRNAPIFENSPREEWNEIASNLITRGIRFTASVDMGILYELAMIINGSRDDDDFDWNDDGR